MPRLRPVARGAATLVVVIVLFFVMALVAAYASRNLVVEQRVANAVLDATLANEAAQFGLDQTLALLNADALGSQCEGLTAGSGLRERWLAIDEQGYIAPRWGDSSARPMVCDRTHSGNWACQCPSNHKPTLLAQGQTKTWSVRVGLAPALAVPGAVGLVAEGCAQASAACGLGFNAHSADSTQYVDTRRAMRVALLPALSQAPAAAITTLGPVDLGSGLLVAHNQQATVLRSGGPVSGNTGQVQGAPGAVGPVAVVDPALSQLTPEDLLRRTFGMASSHLSRHAALRTVACSGTCQAQLSALAKGGAQFVRIEGDLVLNQAASLGTAERPLLVLVEGDLKLQAAVDVHGLLVVRGSASLAAPAQVQGALIAGGNVQGAAGAAVVWNGAVLQRLQTQVGSFVKLSGGEWSPR
jgi:Tfp pilus assembly protein PilX